MPWSILGGSSRKGVSIPGCGVPGAWAEGKQRFSQISPSPEFSGSW